jgi:peptidoglycan/LPS O-acetylase OafA/YrhL
MWILCLLLGLTIPVCRPVESTLINESTNLVAKYSYGVYLTHVFAIGAIEGLMPGPPVVQWAAMLVLLPGLAYIAYHGIEKRGIALGIRLAAKLEREDLRGAAGADQAGRL